LEEWNIGIMGFFLGSIIPSFQHSIIPINLGDFYDGSSAWLFSEGKGDDVQEKTRGLFE
jgi:hypothetical protein